MTAKPEDSLITLRDYVDTRFEALEARMHLMAESEVARIAVTKDEAKLVAQGIEQRFEDVKERTALALENSTAAAQGRMWAIGIGVTVLSTLAASAVGFGLHFIK